MKPFLGMVARPIVENNCKRLGMNSDKITREDLEKLLPIIEREVIFFSDEKVGSEANKKLKEFYKGL
jgi:hypothetical protein